jgi:hypothetical protein
MVVPRTRTVLLGGGLRARHDGETSLATAMPQRRASLIPPAAYAACDHSVRFGPARLNLSQAASRRPDLGLSLPRADAVYGHSDCPHRRDR